ncbi:MAG TPA: hypothetical protein VJS11_04700 [Acidobacteriaceae bacterium]|nr:hypothetical protein [Acidobacteriaceae bacterium]
MRYRISFAALFAALGLLCLTGLAPQSHAQIAVQIGPQPDCPYGYYPYAPYDCAPYGYYGPEWFPNGIFIGAGPWFHGPRDWRGHYDDHFDRRYGYRGDYPRRGEHDRWEGNHWQRHPEGGFRGNRMMDGRGHEYRGGGEHGRGHEGH